MPIMRPCLGINGRPCGALVLASERRCPACALAWTRATRSRTVRHRTPAWDRLSHRLLAEHRRTAGPWCPGIPGEHDAHPAHDLTLDHVTPLHLGGTDDRTNARVLCRQWNSSIGGALSRGGRGGR